MALQGIFVNGATSFIQKLVSVAAKKIGKAGAIDKDLQKLKHTLEMIAAVTSDAEKKQVKEKTVLLWLRRLQDVAFDADDLLDEISYEAIRWNMERVTLTSKINFGLDIAKRIQIINHKLDGIARDKVMFQLEHDGVDDLTEKLDRMTISFIGDFKIVGREKDASRILEMLSDNSSPQENVSVVSIVGMGGIGKTTLAQLVYKDHYVERSFEQRAWVCISDDFDIFLILRKILESITGNSCHLSTLDVLARKVREHITGKKYFLVLDDLWNENAEDWEKFRGILSVGARGSKILVTTRKESVASIVRGTIQPYNLAVLDNDECWLIIKDRAFSPGGAVENLTMSSIGEAIANKCAGLPLAANFLGNLMRLKKKESDWVAIRDDDVFNTPENPNKIILILKLSYDNLPSYLKQCFSYCCLFPKDWEFDTETMIRLWIAEGFIHPSNDGSRSSLEDIGNAYFLSLLSNSFFQVTDRDDLGDVLSFKMHDLVHDLALSVVGSHEVMTLNANKVKADVSQMRRLRLIMEGVPAKEFHVLENATKLRTIILQDEGLVGTMERTTTSSSSFKRLRAVLRLDCDNVIGTAEKTTISSSSFKFKHMRYLDLRSYDLKDVHAAESIHQLYHLQTLNLHGSRNVHNILKEEIATLVNLRHLYLGVSDAKFLPDSVTRLTNLQSLDICFCMDMSALPTNIGHLQNLSYLDISYTSISELPDSLCLLRNLAIFNFTLCFKLEALPRNFGALTQLRSLSLGMTLITKLPDSFSNNICKIELVEFGINCKFPADMTNWVELRHLKYLGNADQLIMPRGIEKLTRLEVLNPFSVSIKEDDVSCSYNSTSGSLQELANLNSLQKLTIINLENVRGGKIEAEMAKLKDKQNIQDLKLQWNFKQQEEMVVNNSSMVVEGLQPHPNLKKLWIRGFPGLKFPKWIGSSSCLLNLVELDFDDCKSCEKLVGLGQLPCLRILTLSRMNSVKCLGKYFYYQQQDEEEAVATTLFRSLIELTIEELENLEEWYAPDNSFPCLEKVKISECGNLKSIPDLRLWTSSLRQITIKNCEKLEKEAMASYFDKYLPSVKYTWGDNDDEIRRTNADEIKRINDEFRRTNEDDYQGIISCLEGLSRAT